MEELASQEGTHSSEVSETHGDQSFLKQDISINTEPKKPVENGEGSLQHNSKRKSHREESESTIPELKDLKVDEDSTKDIVDSLEDETKPPEKTKDKISLTEIANEESALAHNAVQPEEKKSASGFIFGQNLIERITNVPPFTSTFPTFGSLAAGSSASSGFGFLAASVKPCGFSLVNSKHTPTDETASSVKPAKDAENTESDVKDQNKEETESTQQKLEKIANKEYEAQKQKVVLDEVHVITGEEGEWNVFEINVKLYGYNKDSQQWKERGRTNIRLNDAQDNTYSRLVVRMAGTLRIIVNTKLWREMIVKRLSDKNVSFSAFDTDENTPKVFLISCSPADADLFFSELSTRIDRLKSYLKTNGRTDDAEVSGSINPPKEEPQPAKKPKLYDESKE